MKIGKCFYEKTQSIPMVIHCNDGKYYRWCTICDEPCDEYKENRKLFWKFINSKKTEEPNLQQEIHIHITPGMLPTKDEDSELEELRKTQEIIDTIQEGIKELQDDEELKKLMKQIEKTQLKIEKRKAELGIPTLEEEKSQLASKLQIALQEFASSIDDAKWGPNQFTKGKKTEFSTTNGTVSILRSTRTVRKIDVAKLLAENPLIIQKFAEEGKLGLNISDAEKEMSTNDINRVSNKTITHTYELNVKERHTEYGSGK